MLPEASARWKRSPGAALAKPLGPGRQPPSQFELWEQATSLAAAADADPQILEDMESTRFQVNHEPGRRLFRKAVEGGHLKVVRWFFEHGYELCGDTYPVFTPYLPVLRYLVQEQGMSVDVLDRQKGTPLHHGVLFQEEAVVRYLLETGARIDGRNAAQETPLICAAKYGYNDMVELLLEQGADPTLEDYWGDTALHHVSDAHTALALLNHGAKLLAINSEGLAPLDMQTGEVAALLSSRELSAKTSSAAGPPQMRRL